MNAGPTCMRMLLLGLAFAIGCDGQPLPAGISRGTGEQTRIWTSSLEDVRRFCDGENLVYLFLGYQRGGLAVVPNGCMQDAHHFDVPWFELPRPEDVR